MFAHMQGHEDPLVDPQLADDGVPQVTAWDLVRPYVVEPDRGDVLLAEEWDQHGV
jgi:hypothetical protein